MRFNPSVLPFSREVQMSRSRFYVNSLYVEGRDGFDSETICNNVHTVIVISMVNVQNFSSSHLTDELV